jgi:thiol-disulfide isomerase/thioredoxin
MHALALAALLSVLSATPAPREWRDSIRDVHIDGKLVRDAQTLTTSAPRMIAVVCGEEVLLLDPEKQTVTKAPKSAFAFSADRTSAKTENDLQTEPAGTLVRSGTTLLANANGSAVLVTSHQSKAGPMSIEELWATAPVWRSIADVYQPDAKLVERLRAIDREVTLDVVLATWCGDSRQHVPRLLKSIAEANNPKVKVALIGIDAEFHAPMDVIAKRNITNVPTIIVRDGDEELGRVIETPAGATVEDDVCDILEGTPKPHPSRYERGALLSSGTYLLRDAKNRHEGTESFAIYARPAGGVIAHSVIAKRDGTSIETWAWDRFIEVTHRAKTGMTRTRIRRDGETWALNSRGVTGLVEQVVQAPAAFVAPATITYAWARNAESAYVVSERGVGVTQALQVRVGEGEIPRFVKLADGSTRTLVR